MSSQMDPLSGGPTPVAGDLTQPMDPQEFEQRGDSDLRDRGDDRMRSDPRDDYYPRRPDHGSDHGRDRYRDDYDRPAYYDERQRPPRRYYRDDDDSGFAEGASRFAKRHLRTGETKEFFKTSEFFVTLLGVTALIIAAAIQDNFDAHGMWRLVTALLIAYVLSRGIAKAGSDKRDGRGR
jgi:hypothetical protein